MPCDFFLSYVSYDYVIEPNQRFVKKSVGSISRDSPSDYLYEIPIQKYIFNSNKKWLV